MSSPITGKDWIIATAGQPFCDRMTNLLSLATKLRTWFEWAFDSSGSATDEFKSMFLLPPGVVIPYYSTGSEEAVKSSVLLLNGGDSTSPYWRLCDGTNSTPDLRGRVIVGSGQGDGLTNRIIGSTFGSETHTLVQAEIPAHSHTPTSSAITSNKIALHPGYSVQEAGGDGNDSYSFQNSPPTFASMSDLFVSAGGGGAHNNIQPSIALWHIIRTSRTQ